MFSNKQNRRKRVNRRLDYRAKPGLRTTKVKRYGWLPDIPDKRDYMVGYEFKLEGSEDVGKRVLPIRVDMTALCPPVYDQGALGSCTANAIAGAIEFDQMKQKQIGIAVPSRLFIYYNERVIEGTVNEDAGAMIRDGIKSVNVQGAPSEKLWPYRISKFKVKPTLKAYKDAVNHQALKYARVTQTEFGMKAVLASGLPIIFGFAVYESFESDNVEKTGEVPMPADNEEMIGGHAVLAVGYDESTKRFRCRNSWGKSWGRDGYFTMPYEYMTDRRLADDLWVIKTME
jgi:C1A family cysteine protease